MQIVVERDELVRALGHVAHVPLRKTDVQILTCLLISAGGEGGSVRATNIEIDITAPFIAQVAAAGRIAVNARLLHDIVKRMPADQDVTLSLTKGKLLVASGKARFEIGTLQAEDYPDFSLAGKGSSWRFEIEADRLRGQLTAVRHAISKEETRHYLNGVHLHVAEEPAQLKAVATTGHMLALQSCMAPEGSEGMPAIIIPREAVAEMIKLLPDKSEPVTLTVSDRFVWLDLPGGLSFGSKLIEGTYPEYGRVIPREHPNFACIDADALAAALDRVATICDAANTGITLIMDPKGGVTVTAERPEIGSASDRIEAEEIAGARAAIGFNCRYLAVMLQGYAGAKVELRYNSAADPVLMRQVGSEIGLQVLMPMRTAASEQLEKAA
jgi:DNA polymerase-3 subunit beta